MLAEFKQFMHNQCLCHSGEPILAAVSGGSDSMVMLHLLVCSGYITEVAHCNFGLRGNESDSDEQFVREFAAGLGLPFHCRRFETQQYAKQRGISIQMAARELRYDWFEEVRAARGCQAIAVAHQREDNVETVLMNLIRGTGIRGLAGMKARMHRIIRPLLFAPKAHITEYARQNQIPFLDDSSNTSLKYKRNKIRHELIPLLQNINPEFLRTFSENIQHFHDAAEIYSSVIDQLKCQITENREGAIWISLQHIKEFQHPATLLYELLWDYGFTYSQVLSIMSCLSGTSGKQFISDTHILVKDREHLILTIRREDNRVFYISKDCTSITEPVSLTFTVVPADKNFKPDNRRTVACIDYDRLDFPLLLRHWQKGDAFYPLGLQGSKKLSDFFIDEKIPLTGKHGIWLLTQDDKIIWVVGYRLDDRFKITPSTQKVLIVSMNE